MAARQKQRRQQGQARLGPAAEKKFATRARNTNVSPANAMVAGSLCRVGGSIEGRHSRHAAIPTSRASNPSRLVPFARRFRSAAAVALAASLSSFSSWSNVDAHATVTERAGNRWLPLMAQWDMPGAVLAQIRSRIGQRECVFSALGWLVIELGRIFLRRYSTHHSSPLGVSSELVSQW